MLRIFLSETESPERLSNLRSRFGEDMDEAMAKKIFGAFIGFVFSLVFLYAMYTIILNFKPDFIMPFPLNLLSFPGVPVVCIYFGKKYFS